MATERIVIDASAAVRASITGRWQALDGLTLVAPTLMWSQAAAGIRHLEARRQISAAESESATALLVAADVEPFPSRRLLNDARVLASRLGWASTYDAEYVVLARRLGVRLLTLDTRLGRALSGLVELYEG